MFLYFQTLVVIGLIFSFVTKGVALVSVNTQQSCIVGENENMFTFHNSSSLS